MNRQDKSISDDPLLQRACGKAPTFSTALLLSWKYINLTMHDFVSSFYSVGRVIFILVS